MAFRWHDDLLRGKLQSLDEALTQLGQVVQRSSQKRDVAAYGAPAGKPGDGLHDHGLENGGGDVVAARAFVQERLHVSLGKNAAARRDGVDGRVAGGHLIEAGRVGVEQGGHLVDEGAGTTRAGAVHALLDAVVEVDNLRVLAAQLDGHVGGRYQSLDRRLVGDDLLDKGHGQPL